MNDRDWNKDGRTLNANDARQVVESYRESYGATRFRWLMIQAANAGRSPEIDAVFRAAIDQK